MIARHAKSPCCGASIRRFGHRRRQCSKCQKTWSIRPKRRGRPRHRTRIAVIQRALLGRYTLRQLAAQRGLLSAPTLRYRFRNALAALLRQPYRVRFPVGALILLADGMRFQFRGRPWVLYLTAVKACGEKRAVFLDPLLIAGREGAVRWRQAFAAIPKGIRVRICGLVVDNLNGMDKIARERGWILQLCHFHLIHKLQFHRRGRYRALKGGKIREEIYWLVRQALEKPTGVVFEGAVMNLQKRAHSDCGTVRMQAVVREFLHCLPHYRAYQGHPELGMPTTTNVMESMGGVLRDTFRRSHSATNPKSLLGWATALIRLRPELVCNGTSSTD